MELSCWRFSIGVGEPLPRIVREAIDGDGVVFVFLAYRAGGGHHSRDAVPTHRGDEFRDIHLGSPRGVREKRVGHMENGRRYTLALLL